ncbi:MAG: magnesium and cobalt transport protein CorA [Candidatus Nanopelagicales bacterium]
MIRGLGAYHPGGIIDVVDDSPRHIPSDTDLTGEAVRKELRELLRSSREYADGFVWVGLLDPTKPELLAVQEVFNLEHLQVEDAANSRQRAKVDVSDDGTVFTVLKTLGYDEESLVMDTGQVAIFTGPGYAVTVRHGQHGDLASIRDRLKGSAALREHGSLAVLYAIMDMTVDGYLAVVDAVAEDVSEVETDVFAMNPTTDVTKRIYELKRENMQARHAVQPLGRVAHEFADEVFEPMPEALKPFFRDIGEHILRAHEAIENIDSLLMTMLMASTAMQDLRQNSDTRKISAWVAIAAVPTVVGGIYGMNFENMPELEWEGSYPLVIGAILVVCLLMYRGFKRNGWL